MTPQSTTEADGKVSVLTKTPAQLKHSTNSKLDLMLTGLKVTGSELLQQKSN